MRLVRLQRYIELGDLQASQGMRLSIENFQGDDGVQVASHRQHRGEAFLQAVQGKLERFVTGGVQRFP
jgi:hypothetical protein